MPDPALLDLVKHLQWSPPAIIQAAPIELSEPSLAAYAVYLEGQERKVETWIEAGQELRTFLWGEIQKPQIAVTIDGLTEMIDRFEASLIEDAKVLARKGKAAHRNERSISDLRKRDVVARHHQKMLAIMHRHYQERLDFATFLRAMRAEIDPESRGGSSFDNPQDLARSLLGGVIGA